MRKRTSLQYELMQRLNLDSVKNNNTRSAQIKDVKAFAGFCKEHGLSPLTQPQESLQAYSDALVEGGRYSAGTIHRKLSGPCKALSVTMDQISKPKRTADKITRGRRPDGTKKRGDMEAERPRFARLVSFQRAVGIRRAELARLRGRDLVTDESGYLCVSVRKGKGGKDQLQRIAPGQEDLVRSVFASVGPAERVFSASEMANKINLHGLRAEAARQAYRHYQRELAADPSVRGRYMAELRRRYIAANPHGSGGVDRWLREIDSRAYLLRGANRRKAAATGQPVEYDRLALMMVSVFHLSHWRLDVTVTNYMIK